MVPYASISSGDRDEMKGKKRRIKTEEARPPSRRKRQHKLCFVMANGKAEPGLFSCATVVATTLFLGLLFLQV